VDYSQPLPEMQVLDSLWCGLIPSDVSATAQSVGEPSQRGQVEVPSPVQSAVEEMGHRLETEKVEKQLREMRERAENAERELQQHLQNTVEQVKTLFRAKEDAEHGAVCDNALAADAAAAIQAERSKRHKSEEEVVTLKKQLAEQKESAGKAETRLKRKFEEQKEKAEKAETHCIRLEEEGATLKRKWEAQVAKSKAEGAEAEKKVTLLSEHLQQERDMNAISRALRRQSVQVIGRHQQEMSALVERHEQDLKDKVGQAAKQNTAFLLRAAAEHLDSQ